MLKRKSKKAKSISSLKAAAWKLFSEYVRRKYSFSSGYGRCFTCGKYAHWKELQCGHGIPGRNGAVLFDEEICRPQCVACNIFSHGNLHIFATKMMLLKDNDWWIKKLADSKDEIKRTRSDYEELIEELKLKLESLDNG